MLWTAPKAGLRIGKLLATAAVFRRMLKISPSASEEAAVEVACLLQPISTVQLAEAICAN
jgi:hypothetical protein